MPKYAVEAGRLITRDGVPFVGLTKKEDASPFDADWFARRIVAAVNSVAGVPTDALESGVLVDLMNLAWDVLRLTDRGGSTEEFNELGHTAKALTERFRAKLNGRG